MQLEQPDGPSNCPEVQKGSKWFGKYPYLQLIHAIIDDIDIIAAYIWLHHVSGGQMAAENRRLAESVQSNVWHMVAQKWNFPTTLL